MRMKSEYDRSYQWNGPGDDIYTNRWKQKRVTEPIMTHKRRVKSTEDNVIIGQPLPSQSDDIVKEDPYFVLGAKNKKFHPSVPYRNKKALEKHRDVDRTDGRKTDKKPNKNESSKTIAEERRIKFVNEAVQTDSDHLDNVDFRKEKSTQIAVAVPEALGRERGRGPVVNNVKEKPPVSESLKKPAPPASGLSEYQTKYAWVEPVGKQTQAFDKVSENKSKLDVKLKIYNSFMSEYQQQYRPYEFVSENRFKRMKPSPFTSLDDAHIKVVPRRALTPPPFSTQSNDQRPATSSPNHARNPQRFHFPHGKHKRFLTEYSANFDNKWKTLELDLEKNLREEETRQSNRQSKWFKEILDLRKKAEEYRQRTRGTHFSREHLGEIFMKPEKHENEDCLDGKARSAENFRSRRRRSPARRSLTPTSISSSYNSTIVGKSSRNNSRSPDPRSSNWMDKSAGKPSFDNNLLLDEVASHDTELKDVAHTRKYVENNPEKKYTMQRYFNETNTTGAGRDMRTIDYDVVSRETESSRLSSVKSIISSSSRSLALETLERAKRNRDQLMRSQA